MKPELVQQISTPRYNSLRELLADKENLPEESYCLIDNDSVVFFGERVCDDEDNEDCESQLLWSGSSLDDVLFNLLCELGFDATRV